MTRRQAAKPYRPLSTWWHRAVLLWIAGGIIIWAAIAIWSSR